MINQKTALLCIDGKLKIKWEDSNIEIPFNFDDMRDTVLYKVVRGLQEQVKNLKEELKVIQKEQTEYIRYKFNKISDEMAKEQIIGFLKERKKQRNEVTLFEISQVLKIPADQVENIIDNLKKEGCLEWVEK